MSRSKPLPPINATRTPGLVEQLQEQNREQGTLIDALSSRLNDAMYEINLLKDRVEQLQAQFPEGTF